MVQFSSFTKFPNFLAPFPLALKLSDISAFDPYVEQLITAYNNPAAALPQIVEEWLLISALLNEKQVPITAKLDMEVQVSTPRRTLNINGACSTLSPIQFLKSQVETTLEASATESTRYFPFFSGYFAALNAHKVKLAYEAISVPVVSLEEAKLHFKDFGPHTALVKFKTHSPSIQKGSWGAVVTPPNNAYRYKELVAMNSHTVPFQRASQCKVLYHLPRSLTSLRDLYDYLQELPFPYGVDTNLPKDLEDTIKATYTNLYNAASKEDIAYLESKVDEFKTGTFLNLANGLRIYVVSRFHQVIILEPRAEYADKLAICNTSSGPGQLIGYVLNIYELASLVSLTNEELIKIRSLN